MTVLSRLAAGWLFLSSAVVVAAEHVVEIRDNAFSPAVVAVKAGDSVRWINLEKRTSHSVLFVAPVAFESERMFPGESWIYRFDKPGEHAYRCGPHPEMLGKVLVAD